MKSRRERREEARKEKKQFEPQYSTGVRTDGKGNEYVVGGAPKNYEEVFGVGYERFNNKFVTIKEIETEESEEETE